MVRKCAPLIKFRIGGFSEFFGSFEDFNERLSKNLKHGVARVRVPKNFCENWKSVNFPVKDEKPFKSIRAPPDVQQLPVLLSPCPSCSAQYEKSGR